MEIAIFITLGSKIQQTVARVQICLYVVIYTYKNTLHLWNGLFKGFVVKIFSWKS